jgi:hypothetical protein
MSGRLLTIDEACLKLGGVKPWTIRSWVSQRRIPYTKGWRLPNPHLLMRPFIQREAVLSSRIEGALAALGELPEASRLPIRQAGPIGPIPALENPSYTLLS